MAALLTQRPKVTTGDGLNVGIPNQARGRTGSHVLGPSLSWRMSVSTFSESVWCLFASKITSPLKCRRNLLFQTLQSTRHRTGAPEWEVTQNPHCSLVRRLPPACAMNELTCSRHFTLYPAPASPCSPSSLNPPPIGSM